MLEEGAVVGAGAERTQSQIPLRQVLARLFVAGGANPRPVAVGEAQARLRIDHVALDLGPELRQGMAAAEPQEAASIAVGVGIQDGLLREFLAVFLRPLGGSHEPLLLGTPGGEHQSAAWTFRQLGDRLGLGEHGDEPGDRVAGTVVPGVMVVAAQHPLVGKARALETRDDVHGRHRAPVELHRESYGGRTRADAVGDGQRAAPRGWCDRALDGIEKRLGVAVADGQRGDCGHRRCLVPAEAPSALDGSPSRREEVACVQWQIHDRAALHPAVVFVRALGIDLARVVAVVGGVGEDQAADRPVLGGEFRLDAPEHPAVANDDDLALDVDAVARQQFVVFARAVVDVDQFAGDIAVRRESVVRGQHVGGCAAGIPLDRTLGQRGREGVGSRHRQAPRRRSGQKNFVAGHLDVVAPIREPAPEGLDVAGIVARAEVVWLPGQLVHPRGQVVGVEMAVVGGFQPMLRGSAGFGETE